MTEVADLKGWELQDGLVQLYFQFCIRFCCSENSLLEQSDWQVLDDMIQ